MVIDCILCENNTNCVNGMDTTDECCANCVLNMWLDIGQKDVSNWKNCNKKLFYYLSFLELKHQLKT